MAWRTYGFDVNGLPVAAWYREETVEQVLAPLARPSRALASGEGVAGPSRATRCAYAIATGTATCRERISSARWTSRREMQTRLNRR